MSYNGTSRKVKADATRQKIYESAEQLFLKDDYHHVSVDSIVKAAGVSKGSFYVHFASKDALIAVLINNHVAKADMDYKNFLDTLADNTLSAETMFLSLIGKIADVLTDTIGYNRIKAVYKAQIIKDIDTAAIMNYNRDLYKMFSNVLERGIKTGEFKSEIPIDTLTRHFVMAIRGITYEWCIRYPEFDYKAQAIQHFRILLAGLKR